MSGQFFEDSECINEELRIGRYFITELGVEYREAGEPLPEDENSFSAQLDQAAESPAAEEPGDEEPQ